MSDEIHVKIGGRAIHNAVKNYLKDNDDLKAAILIKVNAMVADGTLDALARDAISKHMTHYTVNDVVRKAAKEVLAGHVKEVVDGMIKDAINAALKNAVMILPKAALTPVEPPKG